MLSPMPMAACRVMRRPIVHLRPLPQRHLSLSGWLRAWSRSYSRHEGARPPTTPLSTRPFPLSYLPPTSLAGLILQHGLHEGGAPAAGR